MRRMIVIWIWATVSLYLILISQRVEFHTVYCGLSSQLHYFFHCQYHPHSHSRSLFLSFISIFTFSSHLLLSPVAIWNESNPLAKRAAARAPLDVPTTRSIGMEKSFTAAMMPEHIQLLVDRVSHSPSGRQSALQCSTVQCCWSDLTDSTSHQYLLNLFPAIVMCSTL